jgi:MFS family permease
MSTLAGSRLGSAGPRRAVVVLSLTQIMGWGVLFYPPTLTMTYVAAVHGWSLAVALSGFSIALGMSGLIAPLACGLIDRRGGNLVMSVGALIGAAGLLVLPLARNYPEYVVGWLCIGVAMASILYDPAFTTLTRLFGMASRRPITVVTFAGGLASTVAWPVTQLLIDRAGWQSVYYVFASVLAVVVAPLHAFALPAQFIADKPMPAIDRGPVEPAKTIAPQGWPFILIAAGFTAHAFVLSSTSAHLLAILQRGGIDAGTAVTIGALFGPAQVVTRFADFMTGGRVHPLWVARASMALMACAFAILALAGFSLVSAVIFALAFGAANGVVTIARGALPLAMFGAEGYGRVVGRISRPAQILQASAPFAMALVIDRWSDQAALDISVAVVLIALCCFAAIRRP